MVAASWRRPAGSKAVLAPSSALKTAPIRLTTPAACFTSSIASASAAVARARSKSLRATRRLVPSRLLSIAQRLIHFTRDRSCQFPHEGTSRSSHQLCLYPLKALLSSLAFNRTREDAHRQAKALQQFARPLSLAKFAESSNSKNLVPRH